MTAHRSLFGPHFGFHAVLTAWTRATLVLGIVGLALGCRTAPSVSERELADSLRSIASGDVASEELLWRLTRSSMECAAKHRRALAAAAREYAWRGLVVRRGPYANEPDVPVGEVFLFACYGVSDGPGLDGGQMDGEFSARERRRLSAYLCIDGPDDVRSSANGE